MNRKETAMDRFVHPFRETSFCALHKKSLATPPGQAQIGSMLHCSKTCLFALPDRLWHPEWQSKG